MRSTRLRGREVREERIKGIGEGWSGERREARRGGKGDKTHYKIALCYQTQNRIQDRLSPRD